MFDLSTTGTVIFATIYLVSGFFILNTLRESQPFFTKAVMVVLALLPFVNAVSAFWIFVMDVARGKENRYNE